MKTPERATAPVSPYRLPNGRCRVRSSIWKTTLPRPITVTRSPRKRYCGPVPRVAPLGRVAAAEIKLERIITQKWIAMYPEGCEAWAEQRRTGYPRLFPVRFNHSKGQSIDTETMIRRLPYPRRSKPRTPNNTKCF